MERLRHTRITWYFTLKTVVFSRRIAGTNDRIEEPPAYCDADQPTITKKSVLSIALTKSLAANRSNEGQRTIPGLFLDIPRDPP